MATREKLNKKQKIWIIIATILFVVLVFSCVMFGLWLTVAVTSKTVTFDQLKSKIGKYVAIPDCIGEYATDCIMFFPEREPWKEHQYAKYNHLTVRDKHFVGYRIGFEMNDISGSVYAKKLSYQSPNEGPIIPPPRSPEEIELYSYKEYIYDGITYKYRFIDRETNDNYTSSIFYFNFDKGDFNYSISVSSLTAEKEELINTVKLIWGDIV